MSKKVLYGYAGLFKTPDEIIKAAKTVAEKGYKKFDVHTPYPVHGMDRAMKLPPSKLGYVALVLGLSGATFAFLFMTWILTSVYPNIIGGKPFFSFPAFVPVTFEVTVLSASVGTVIALIAFLFKFPNNSHPLHDTSYMKNVSCDRFGICLEAEDKLFNEDDARRFLEELRASDIEAVYYEEEKSIAGNIFEPRFLIILILITLVTSGATYFGLNKLSYMTPFDWMMEQPKLTAQDTSPVFFDGFGMRTPVEGTVARSGNPLRLENKPEIYEAQLINPLTETKKVLELGKNKFNTYCSPCHGYNGEGDSRLNGQFPNPPSLHSEKVRNWKDGRIFYVIDKGQNVMPSYSSQLTQEERWAVIHYIRALQRSQNAKEADLNE